MKWCITFYSKKVEEETLGFPTGILANFIHIAEMIEEFGPALGKPYTASMGDGLFEISGLAHPAGTHPRVTLLIS
ncbi:type II toxin-antitoxin system RelE/ParE family toxin [Endozoicomonas euniceicola]|uniref:type II toxin-antitoxin system RelE/ParE family toxin n=1 Tax=Endozoicomonas euniceicola TaxID=1234143 RepID=UPI00384A61AC